MSTRILPGPAAMVLGACVLALAACDSRQAPPAAAAGAAVDTVPAGPAAAQAVQAIEQVRTPYVAQSAEPGLDSLGALVGTYRHDGVDFLQQGVLAARLKSLLGGRYAVLLDNLGTSGPLRKEGELLSMSGNRPHQGGEEMAAIVIDPARNGLRVWLLSQGHQTVFTDVEGDDIPWPPEVQITLDNQTDMGPVKPGPQRAPAPRRDS